MSRINNYKKDLKSSYYINQRFKKLRATSIVAAIEPKKQKLPLWPEWNEADLNAEKWEVGGKAKEPKVGKSPSAPVGFIKKYYYFF